MGAPRQSDRATWSTCTGCALERTGSDARSARGSLLRNRRDALAEGRARPDRDLVSPAEVDRDLLTRWVWLLGLAAQVVGVVLQGAALDRGRVSIIQPLLVTTVIWALPLGYFLTDQAIGRREVTGAAIVVGGLALFASFGHPAAGVNDAPASDWIASILVIGTGCAALLLFANRGSLSTKAALLGTVAGLLYGLSATLMKPVVEAFTPTASEASSPAGSSGCGSAPGSSASCFSSCRSRPEASCHRWPRCRWPTPSSA
jgi:drug/metabolite transporter (DMT)-like permease